MPIFDQANLLGSTGSGITPQIPEPQSPNPENQSSFTEALGAAFTLDNTVYNLVREATDVDIQKPGKNVDFDPFENDGALIAGYEEYADRFIGANHAGDIALTKFEIDFENKQKETLANTTGFNQLASSLLANTIDPLAVVPVIKGISAATKTGKIAQGALQGAAIGATAGTARQGVLTSVQQTKDLDESLVDIATETMVGGLLGGVVGGLATPMRSSSRIILSDALQGTAPKMRIKVDINGKPIVEVEKSVGAAQTRQSLEDEGLAHMNETLAKALGGPEGLRSPTLRGVTSDSLTLRSLTNKFFNHNFILNKETKGISRGEVAENLIRRDDAALIQVNKKASDLYLQHVGVKPGVASNVSAKIAESRGKTSRASFNSRVAKAIRNEDLVDDIPEVNEAANLYKTQLDSRVAKLQELDIISKELDPKVARNYLLRNYNVEALSTAAGRGDFIKKVSNYLETHTPNGAPRSAAISTEEALDLADQAYTKIVLQGDRALTFNEVAEKLTKGEVFDGKAAFLIPDEIIEDYLVNNIDDLAGNFLRRSSGAINTKMALRDLGFENMSDVKKGIESDLEVNLAKESDPKKRSKLIKQAKVDAQLAEDMFRSLNGTLRQHDGMSHFTDQLLNFNFLRLLGGVTLSSIPDLAMVPMRNGLLNTFRDGYLPMLRSFKTAKLAKDEFLDLDIGLEAEMNNVLKGLSDTDMDLGRTATAWDRNMDTLTRGFSKATGIDYWTGFGRRMAAHVASSRIARLVNKKELSSSELTELTNLGIGKSDVESVRAMLKKYSASKKGSFISNTQLWPEGRAKQAYLNAVQNATESTVLKPSKGDIPVFAQKTNMGKLLFQFKSFSSSATNKILIRGLQERDARTLMGVMYLTALGSASYLIKQQISGKPTPDDPEEIILQGMQSSGFLGLIGSVALDTTMSVTNPKYSRYASSKFQSQLIGPSFGLAKDGFESIQRLTDGEITANDQKAFLRLIPFNNVFYIKALLDRLIVKE